MNVAEIDWQLSLTPTIPNLEDDLKEWKKLRWSIRNTQIGLKT